MRRRRSLASALLAGFHCSPRRRARRARNLAKQRGLAVEHVSRLRENLGFLRLAHYEREIGDGRHEAPTLACKRAFGRARRAVDAAAALGRIGRLAAGAHAAKLRGCFGRVICAVTARAAHPHRTLAGFHCSPPSQGSLTLSPHSVHTQSSASGDASPAASRGGNASPPHALAHPERSASATAYQKRGLWASQWGITARSQSREAARLGRRARQPLA